MIVFRAFVFRGTVCYDAPFMFRGEDEQKLYEYQSAFELFESLILNKKYPFN